MDNGAPKRLKAEEHAWVIRARLWNAWPPLVPHPFADHTDPPPRLLTNAENNAIANWNPAFLGVPWQLDRALLCAR